MIISVVIRTLNESKYLQELLLSIASQKTRQFSVEVVIVDSGSTDGTIDIANRFGAAVTFINQRDFSFGRSLNIGCEYAKGDILVFVSGHCVPTSDTWLINLVHPLIVGEAVYTYGRQQGRDSTKFSEQMIFEKYFPDTTVTTQEPFFVNNANSAITRDVWSELRFDESVTGLEDMELATRLLEADLGTTKYCPAACVFHIHNESWRQTRRRYEREALALPQIMPEVQVSAIDAVRYFIAAVWADIKVGMNRKVPLNDLLSIPAFRLAQFVGTYYGNLEHRKMSRLRRERYYYPDKVRGRDY